MLFFITQFYSSLTCPLLSLIIYAGPEFGPSNSNPDYTYSMLDSFVPLPGDDNTQCRCKRGAQVSYSQLVNSVSMLAA